MTKYDAQDQQVFEMAINHLMPKAAAKVEPTDRNWVLVRYDSSVHLPSHGSFSTSQGETVELTRHLPTIGGFKTYGEFKARVEQVSKVILLGAGLDSPEESTLRDHLAGQVPIELIKCTRDYENRSYEWIERDGNYARRIGAQLTVKDCPQGTIPCAAEKTLVERIRELQR